MMTLQFIACYISAAVYSGVGGYLAFKPSLVGLTPGQLREMRYKFLSVQEMEY